jgi:hypothetical protein
MMEGAKARAREAGIPFALTPEDIVIPDRCPALGIPLRPGAKVSHNGSPQLDRLIPELGYVRGNVVVISRLANTIKQNATPDQIRAVADWYERIIKSALMR